MSYKILLLHNFYRERGGEDDYVEGLKALLEKNGHTVTPYFKNSKNISSFSILEKLKIPFASFHSRKIEKELEDLIRKTQPDIVHIHNIFPLYSQTIYDVFKKLRIPVVQTIHNYRLMCSNGLFLLNNGKICERCISGNFNHGIVRKCYQKSFIKSFWMAAWLKRMRESNWIWNQVDLFICPSDFVASKLKMALCPPSKIKIIAPFLKDVNVMPAKNKTKPYAIYVGRLSPEKGVRTLLEAFKGFEGMSLKVVGKGPLSEELRKKYGNEKQIEFLGFVDGVEKDRLISEAACLVFPSECYETFGLSILESFRAGTPVIASRLGGRENIVKDGLYGKTFEHKNVASLRQALDSFLSDEAKWPIMRSNARKAFETLYKEENAYQLLIKCYSSVLPNPL